MAFAALLIYKRGSAGSRIGEPYRRDEQPGAFWTMLIIVMIFAAYFLIIGAIYLFKSIQISN